MHPTNHAVFRNAAVSCLALASVAMGTTAQAECTDTNTCFGVSALESNTTGNQNSAFGYRALAVNTIGLQNAAFGFESMAVNIGGSLNTAFGDMTLTNNVNGGGNTAVGDMAMGGNISGYYNVGVGMTALSHNNADDNTAVGADAMRFNVDGGENTAVGRAALMGSHTSTLASEGNQNTAVGVNSILRITTGNENSATGMNALYENRSGNRNVANGFGALRNNVNGDRNVGVGYQAGSALTGNDNIVIGAGNKGTPAENGVIRIGIGTNQKKTFVAGIRGVTTGLANATTVFIDGNGQLGTIKSSRAVKEDIQSMGNVSERLLALRPVTFRYKQVNDDGSKPIQYGLIAEEVAEVFPELVVYDQENKPETVSYHLLATLLVNEFQKDHQQLRSQADEIAQLKSQVARLIDAFATTQAAQMTARNSD